MIQLALAFAALVLAAAVTGVMAGVSLERSRWQRRVDLPACWRCGGTGAERTREHDTSGHWSERLR